MNELDQTMLLLACGDTKGAQIQMNKIKNSDKHIKSIKRIFQLFIEGRHNECEKEIKDFNPIIRDLDLRETLYFITGMMRALVNIVKNNKLEAKRDLADINKRKGFEEIIEKLLKNPEWSVKPNQDLRRQSNSISFSEKPVNAHAECENFAKLYRENSEMVENSKWFVVSSQWFNIWAKYSGLCDSIDYIDLPFKNIQSAKTVKELGKIENSDIINTDELDELNKNSKYKFFLKPGLRENFDYFLLPEKSYSYLNKIHKSSNEIPRFTILNSSGTVTVEVYLKKILLVYLKKSKIVKKQTFLSRSEKIEEIFRLTLNDLDYKKHKNIENQVKIWKINSDCLSINELEKFFLTKTEDYIEGCNKLELSRTVEDSLISDIDYLFCDFSIEGDHFVILNSESAKCKSCAESRKIFDCIKCKSPFCLGCMPKHKSQSKKCNLRKKKTFGLFSCFCMAKSSEHHEVLKIKQRAVSKVANDSDTLSHSNTASQDGEKKAKRSAQELETSTSTFMNSQKGLSLNPTGLQNLGNTCFMNSALQCLVHCEALSLFLLSSNLSDKINKSNPLGTKGKLVMAYTDLLKDLSNGKEKSVAPWLLKKTIATVASQFEGYQQHDSHEFLSYLIAGLHEDLNEIKKKPYHSSDIKYTNDHETSIESWDRHLSRNKSIIVDLMYGQYKSDVCCPKCNKHSYTFDPFNSITLPVPGSNEKLIDVNFIKHGLSSGLFKISSSFPPRCSILEAKTKICNKANVELRELKVFEMKFRVPYRELGDDENFNKVRDGTLHFFEVPENTQALCFVIIGIESTSDDFPCRVLGISTKSTMEELISLIIEELKPVYKDLYDDSDQKPSPKISAFSNFFIECFVCETARCEKLCKVKPSNKPVSMFLADKNHMYLKVLLPNVNRTRPGYNKMKEFVKTKNNSSGNGLTIQDCFRAFSLPDTLDEKNSWYCPNCKKHVQATKKMEIFRAPSVLIIHLKRFKSVGFYREKIMTPISFPMNNLDISEFVKGHNSELYDLFAVSNHFGTLAGGHYTATVFNSLRGKWYECNDSSVTEVDEISEKASYILFYRSKSSRKSSNYI